MPWAEWWKSARYRSAWRSTTCRYHAAETYPGIFGELCRSTNTAQGRILNTVRITKQIATGEFKQDLETLEKVGRRSEKDELVPAFITMMRAVDALVADAEMLENAAAEGKLATRADAAQTQR